MLLSLQMRWRILTTKKLCRTERESEHSETAASGKEAQMLEVGRETKMLEVG